MILLYLPHMSIHINTIKATGMELTSAIEEYARSRAASLEKYVDEKDTSTNMDIEVGKTTGHHQSGEIFRAEFTIQFKGKTIRTTSTNEDLYAAIDEVQSEASRMMSEHKNKKKTMFLKGAAQIKNMLKGKE